MKKLYSFLTAFASIAIAFTACNKETEIVEPTPSDEFVTVSITAGNPEILPDTKTELVGTTPYWSKDDAIGVAWPTDKGYGSGSFASGLTEKALSATFTGEVASGNLGKTAYAFYPYTTNSITTAGIAPIDIPETQYPSSASFDPKADLMVGLESFALSTTVTDLAFRRLGAVVKVIIIDNTTGSVLTGQHPIDVKLTVADGSNLIGRARVDLANMALDGFSSGAKNYVQAIYKSDKYAIDGTNATYFVVYPQVLSENSGITLEGTTEGYTFSKTVSTHPDIDLKAGCITTLKIKVSSATVDAAGADLPFNENFSALDSGNSTSTSGSSTAASTTDLSQFKTIEKGYKAGGAIRLGKAGTLETNSLNLSEDFTVVVKIKGWSSSETTLTAKVGSGDDEQTHDFVATTYIGGDFVELAHKFNADSKKSSVVFTTDANTRVFIDDIKIVKGDYVLTPVISVPSAPAAAKSSDTSIEFNYEITNPTTSGELTVVENADWITGVSVDQENKKVTLTITTATEARNTDITLKYPNAADYVLNVSQDAPAAAAYTLLAAAPSDWTKGWLIICGGDAKALTGGASGYGTATAVTVSSSKISKSAGDEVACSVENGSTSGKYAIKLPNGKYIGKVTSNSFAVSDDPVDLTISVASNGEISIDVNPTTNRFIKYLSSNSNSQAFRCYTTSTGVLPKAYWLEDTEPSLAATDITFDSAVSAGKTSTVSWTNFESDPTVTVTTTPLPDFVNSATLSADGKTLTVNVKDNYTLAEKTGDIELTATLGTVTKTATVHLTQPASVFEASSTANLTYAYNDEDPKSVTITSTFPLTEADNLTNSNETNFTATLTLVTSTTYQYTLEIMPNQTNNEASTNYEAVITVSRNGLSIPINAIQSYNSGTVTPQNVTLQYTGSTTTNMTGSNDAATLGLSDTDWSVVGDTGTPTNLPGLNKDGTIRLYGNANGNGNTITVTSNVGTINSITIDFNSGSDGAKVLVGGNEVSLSNGSFAINSSSFVIKNSYSGTTQVRINSIVITYTPSN